MNDRYKIGELVQKAGVSRRTVHYYIAKGLIPPAIGAGVNSHYNEDHLVRIKLIKKMQEQYLPLDKIRDLVVNFSFTEVKEKLAEEENENREAGLKEMALMSKAVDDFSRQAESREYVRVELGLGIEMNYPKSLHREQSELIESLNRYAKKLIREMSK